MPNKFIITERKTSAVSGRFFTADPSISLRFTQGSYDSAGPVSLSNRPLLLGWRSLRFRFASLRGPRRLDASKYCWGYKKAPQIALWGLESAYGNKTHIYHLTAGN